MKQEYDRVLAKKTFNNSLNRFPFKAMNLSIH